MATTKIAIYGAGGHGKVVAEIAESIGYEIGYFIDKDANKKTHMGYEVKTENTESLPCALGIGSNTLRKMIFDVLEKEGAEILTLIHPKSVISKRVTISTGTVVMAGVIINSEAKVGKGAIINSASIIEHDNTIGDFAHISPNVALAGNVTVGDFTHIGIGSSVIQGVKIGTNCIIGAGSVVINDIKDGAKVVGNPAKKYLN